MSERVPVVAGNWKMHRTIGEARQLVQELVALVPVDCRVEVVVCSPFTALAEVSRVCSGSLVQVGGQDVHWAPSGAFTGDIAAAMLVDAGCRYVLVGHSERRQGHGETDQQVRSKVQAALDAGLLPVLCVGETLEQREQGQAMAVIKRQVEAGLASLTPEQVAGMLVAYEPVWAIGTGRNAAPQDAQEVMGAIRGLVADVFGPAATSLRILYGGSVKPDNIVALMQQPDVDGALVGGASLEAQTFNQIIRLAGEV